MACDHMVFVLILRYFCSTFKDSTLWEYRNVYSSISLDTPILQGYTPIFHVLHCKICHLLGLQVGSQVVCLILWAS